MASGGDGGVGGKGMKQVDTDVVEGYQTINPRYGATLNFNFTQPLLRDFGFKMARRQIIIARNDLEVSEQRLKQALLDTIFDVEQA